MTATLPAARLKAPLQLVLVWHPRSKGDGEEISSFLYSRLNRDETNPNYRGAGIPVYYRTGTSARIALDAAAPPSSCRSSRTA